MNNDISKPNDKIMKKEDTETQWGRNSGLYSNL